MNSYEQQPETMAMQTVGDVVARDYRSAEVFERHGIDFCCGGKITLAAACQEKGIQLADLLRELAQATERPLDRSQNYTAWELPFLADYIVNTHHAYLKENLGPIAAYARKIAEVHGQQHPEVVQIASIFEKMAVDMAAHLREEEEVLFPAIRKLSESTKGGAAPAGEVDTLREALVTLEKEHDQVGDAIHAIRRLAKGYAVPDDVCNTFMLTYRKLQEFEDNLHKHVHLENNILFPKAAKL